MLLEIQDKLVIPTSVSFILYTDAVILRDEKGMAYVRGKIKQIERSPNQIVDNGHSYISNLASGKSIPKMRYMAFGTASGGKNPGSNVLQAELTRVWMTDWDNLVLPNTIYRSILDAGVGTGNLVEAGIFDSQLAGNMLSWADFPLIPKAINDILETRWTHTY